MKDWSEEEEALHAAKIFGGAAERYVEMFMDIGGYADALDQFLALLPQPDCSVLELACGPGNVTAYLLEQRPDLQLFATDLAPEMLALAAQHNPKAKTQILDMRHVAEFPMQVDAIVNAFGLPYLRKNAALRWIADSAKVLKPGGLLFFSTMEGRYQDSKLQTNSLGQQLMQYLHEASYLQAALSAAGFEELALIRQAFQHPNGQAFTDLILIARLSS